MTSKDLMIGDWYAFRGHPYKCTARDIASLAVCEEKGGQTSISEIPLTPEILEKNGFTNGEFYAESHIEDWQIMSDGSHLAARSERGWCIDIPCRYVHELQHCLKLVGIEKDIVL